MVEEQLPNYPSCDENWFWSIIDIELIRAIFDYE